VPIVDDNVDHLAFLRGAVGGRCRVASASNGLDSTVSRKPCQHGEIREAIKKALPASSTG